MTIEEMIPLLGLSGRDPKLRQALTEFNFNEPLIPLPRKDKRISRNEPFGFFARVGETKYHISLYFVYAEHLPPQLKGSFLEGEPVFQYATFYLHKGKFFSDLPFGLVVSDTRPVFREKLNEPSDVRGRTDYWNRGKYRFNAQFGQDDKVEYVQVALPI